MEKDLFEMVGMYKETFSVNVREEMLSVKMTDCGNTVEMHADKETFYKFIKKVLRDAECGT